MVRARPEREDLARRRELAVGLLREAVAVEPLRIGEVLLVAVRGGEEDDDLLARRELLARQLVSMPICWSGASRVATAPRTPR